MTCPTPQSSEGNLVCADAPVDRLRDSDTRKLGEPRSRPMFVLHATKKLLNRLGPAASGPLAESTTAMGSWYGTALFWKPQVALFVNEATFLPVLVHLAPAQTVVERFAGSLVHGLCSGRFDCASRPSRSRG